MGNLFTDAVGAVGRSDFARKETDNFTQGGVLGPLLGNKGLGAITGLFGGATDALSGIGGFLGSPMGPIAIAAAGGVVLLILLK